MGLTDEDLCHMKVAAPKINNCLNKLHEHVSPKFTSAEREAFGIENEYGGITGTIHASGIIRLASVLSLESGGLAEQYRLSSDESVFCDIGSGTGRPSLYFGCLPIKASVGFDIDPWQVFCSHNGLNKVKALKSAPLRCPVGTFHADVTKISCLSKVTHAFAFLGYSMIVQCTARAVAKSESVKVFVAVVLHDRELRHMRLLSQVPEENEDIVIVPGLSMTGGSGFRAFVIPMTKLRRRNVLSVPLESNPPTGDATKHYDECVSGIVHNKPVVQDLVPSSTHLGTRRSKRKAFANASALLVNQR